MKRYSITMSTPVGLKYGTMEFVIADGKIRGILSLLEHSEPFRGTIDSKGNCMICGQLITLMRTIHYTAVGCLTEHGIRLRLRGERNDFEIIGTEIKKE
ncbi:MAG: hypothetical protein ACI39H_04880 [Lachnospiraceae bacterium]